MSRDAKPDDAPREFPIEIKVGRTKLTVTLLIAPHATVAVKKTKTETEPESPG